MNQKVAIQRMTRQRRLLMEVMDRKNWHPTAEEIYSLVRQRAPKISLGTVYRNLDILIREGTIRKVETGGPQRRFDGNPAPHAHAQCLDCLEVWDVEIPPDSFIAPPLVMGPDFRFTGLKLICEGYCSKCRPHNGMEAE